MFSIGIMSDYQTLIYSTKALWVIGRKLLRYYIGGVCSCLNDYNITLSLSFHYQHQDNDRDQHQDHRAEEKGGKPKLIPTIFLNTSWSSCLSPTVLSKYDNATLSPYHLWISLLMKFRNIFKGGVYWKQNLKMSTCGYFEQFWLSCSAVFTGNHDLVQFWALS